MLWPLRRSPSRSCLHRTATRPAPLDDHRAIIPQPLWTRTTESSLDCGNKLVLRLEGPCCVDQIVRHHCPARPYCLRRNARTFSVKPRLCLLDSRHTTRALLTRFVSEFSSCLRFLQAKRIWELFLARSGMLTRAATDFCTLPSLVTHMVDSFGLHIRYEQNALCEVTLTIKRCMEVQAQRFSFPPQSSPPPI